MRESREEGGPTPVLASSRNFVVTTSYDFAYSAFGLREPSFLLFLCVRISGCEVRALVDSGSNRTFLGPEAVDCVKRLGFRFRAAAGRQVTTAMNQTTRVKGETNVPIAIQNKICTPLRVYSLPTLALSYILGMDFLMAFSVVVGFVNGT